MSEIKTPNTIINKAATTIEEHEVVETNTVHGAAVKPGSLIATKKSTVLGKEVGFVQTYGCCSRGFKRDYIYAASDDDTIAQLRAAQEALSKEEETRVAAESQRENLRKTVEDKNNRVLRLEQQLRDLDTSKTKEIDTLQSTLSRERQDSHAEIARQVIAEQEKAQKKLNDATALHQRELNGANDSIQSSEQRRKELENELLDVKQKNTAAQTAQGLLKADMEALKTQLQRTEESDSAERDRLLAQIKQRDGEIAKLNVEINKSTKVIQTLQNQQVNLDKLAVKANELKKDIAIEQEHQQDTQEIIQTTATTVTSANQPLKDERAPAQVSSPKGKGK